MKISSLNFRLALSLPPPTQVCFKKALVPFRLETTALGDVVYMTDPKAKESSGVAWIMYDQT